MKLFALREALSSLSGLRKICSVKYTWWTKVIYSVEKKSMRKKKGAYDKTEVFGL